MGSAPHQGLEWEAMMIVEHGFRRGQNWVLVAPQMGMLHRRPRRHGQGGTSPWKCCEVFLCYTMLSKLSVDEVFMHYFENMLSTSGGFAPRLPLRHCPGPHWGTSVLHTPSLTTPGRIRRAPKDCLLLMLGT